MKQNHSHGFSVFQWKDKITLLLQKGNSLHPQLVQSTDGITFRPIARPVTLRSERKTTVPWKQCHDITILPTASELVLSAIHTSPTTTSHIIASSKTGTTWDIIGRKSGTHSHVTLRIGTGKEKRFINFERTARKFIALSVSDDGTRWIDRGIILKPREHHFDALNLHPFWARETKHGIVLAYTADDGYGHTTIGAALFDRHHPEQLLWQSIQPIWSSQYIDDDPKTPLRIIGGIDQQKYFYIYLERKGDIEAFPCAKYWETYVPKTVSRQPSKRAKEALQKQFPHRLARHEGNPILEPNPVNDWESLATFNAAALHLRGRFHFFYRAQGHDGISVLGYAESHDGIHIANRYPHPIYVPSHPCDTRRNPHAPLFPYTSGGGFGGCEDPRACLIDDRIYVIYVAFNGTEPPGVALTSLAVSDFLKHKWKWTPPKLISRRGQIQKNWVIFPEKINGKFAVLHSIAPRILIDYIDNLNDPHLVIDSFHHRESPDKSRWDNIVRGVGAPPIKTDRGWLVLYHAMDYRDPNKYKVGAMLLDLNHPERIITRCQAPILEPETDYENNGHKSGVVYVCGTVIRDDTLFVYYGASDKTLAVATAPLTRFLDALASSKPLQLKKISLQDTA